MFETDGSAGYLPSLPPRLDRARQRSISTAAIDCVGNCRPSIVRAGSRLCGCPRPIRRRLAPKKSANPTLPHPFTGAGGLRSASPRTSKTNHCISLVKSLPSGGLWLNCEDRPAAFARRSESVLRVGIRVLLTRTSMLSLPSNAQSTYKLGCSSRANAGCNERDALQSTSKSQPNTDPTFTTPHFCRVNKKEPLAKSS